MTGCLVKTFVCEERRRRNCSEADETADMQGKERKEMRNPRNEPPASGRRLPGAGCVLRKKWLLLPKTIRHGTARNRRKIHAPGTKRGGKSVRRAGSTHRCRGGRGRTYRRSGAQPGRNLGGRYGSCGNAGPDSRSLDRRRQILVRMYVVCDGRALHHVCGGDCVEPGGACGLWRRRSEAWLSLLFGAGVSAPNDGDAGSIGRGVREARPFVLRCVEKVIFGKCRKKTKFAFPAFRREFRRMVATYRTGRYFRWVCREW